MGSISGSFCTPLVFSFQKERPEERGCVGFYQEYKCMILEVVVAPLHINLSSTLHLKQRFIIPFVIKIQNVISDLKHYLSEGYLLCLFEIFQHLNLVLFTFFKGFLSSVY